MAIDGSDIGKAHIVEHRRWNESRFNVVLEIVVHVIDTSTQASS